MLASRRGFIRIGGLLGASPALGSLFRKLHFEALGAAIPASPVFVLYNNGNGLQRALLRKSLNNGGLVPSGMLGSLAPFAQDMLIADTMPCSVSSYLHGNNTSTYSCASRGKLTDGGAGTGPVVIAGPSIDWVIAKAMAKEDDVEASKLSLAVKLPFRIVDSNCNFGSFLGRSKNEATDILWDPKVVWDQLFKAYAQSAAAPAVDAQSAKAAQREMMRKSVFDGLLVEINDNMNKLPANEKQKLDQYLTSLRTVEKSIASVAPSMPPPEPVQMCSAPSRPGSVVAKEINSNSPAIWDILVDLSALAVGCGIKQQVSLLHSWACGHIGYVVDNFEYDHHHHDGAKPYDENGPIMESILSLHAASVARFWSKLKETKWGGKSAADAACLVWMSDHGGSHHNGDSHHCAVVLSGPDVALKKNAYVQVNSGSNLAEFHFTLAKTFGSPVATFGDGTMGVSGQIAGIKA
jgi:Protein of unknown function (DUF1552)